MADTDHLIQEALDAITHAQGDLTTAAAALHEWQDGEEPPPSDLPSETPRRCREVMDHLGVATHIDAEPYSSNIPKVISALKDLRMTRIRCRIYNNDAEARDNFERIYAETGASFISNLGQPGQAASPAKMVTWVESFTPGTISVIEGNNEPNLQLSGDWAAQTRQWMKDLKAAVRGSAKPWVAELPIAAPALGKREGYEELGPIPEADIGNLHIYQGGDLADFRLDTGLTDAKNQTGDKPVYVTETGYHNALNNEDTHIPTSEKAAGVYVPLIPLEHLLRARSGAAYIYELVDNPPNSTLTDQEAHFGLLRSDWSAKPAFTNLKALSDAMEDEGEQDFPLEPVQLKVTGPADLQHILFKHSDGSYRLALWRRVSVWDKEAQKEVVPAKAAVSVVFAKRCVPFQLSGPVPAGTPISAQLGSGFIVGAFTLG